MLYEPDVMRGNSRVRKAVGDFLLPAMSEALVPARAQWGLTVDQLKDPVLFQGDDPYTAPHGQYPNIGIYITGAANFAQEDRTDHRARHYTYDVECTLYITTRTAYMGTNEAGNDVWEQPYRESAIRQRDDLMAVMREVIFRDRTFRTNDSEDFTIRASISDWRESYHDPMKISDRNPWWVTSAIALTDIKIAEHLQQEYYGNSDDFQIDVGILEQ